MGKDERKQMLGAMLHEHREAKQHLACLNSKARRMSEAVTNVMRLLKGETTGSLSRGNTFAIVRSKGDLIHEDSTWPSAEEIMEVVGDRKKTQEEIAVLESQIREMGFGDYVKE